MMRLVEVGLVLATLNVIVVLGTRVMAPAVTEAETTYEVAAEAAEHQRRVFARVRYWGIRTLLLPVWMIAIGLVVEVFRTG